MWNAMAAACLAAFLSEQSHGCFGSGAHARELSRFNIFRTQGQALSV